jgi:hypothetical protein
LQEAKVCHHLSSSQMSDIDVGIQSSKVSILVFGDPNDAQKTLFKATNQIMV